MGYDIVLEAIKCEHCGSADVEYFGLTYNLSPMLLKCGIGDLFQGGMRQFKVLKFKKALKDIEDNYEEYVLLNPSNGWGNVDGLIELLKEMIEFNDKFKGRKVIIRVD